jgi:hypothetical protein
MLHNKGYHPVFQISKQDRARRWRRTPKRGLRQVDFVFDGNEIRGLEQNPHTKSRWARLARSGKKVMQFLSEGPLRGERGRWESDFLSGLILRDGREGSTMGGAAL